MNINEDILQGILADNGIYASEQEAVFKAIEVKPVDCDECKNSASNNGGYEPCSACSRFYSDCFEPKHNELDNLFIGAPVMMKYSGIANDMESLVTYSDGFTGHEYTRLPTVAESPRNVWLAPWLEMPEELNELVVLFRYESNDAIIYDKGEIFSTSNWHNVEAVMILEELKK